MANELSITLKLACTNGKFSNTLNPTGLTYNQSAQGASSGVWNIGTSEEDFATGDVLAANQGWIGLQNLDPTNYFEYGPKSGGAMVAFGKVKAGEVALFRLDPSIVMRAKANVAAVNVQYLLLQD